MTQDSWFESAGASNVISWLMGHWSSAYTYGTSFFGCCVSLADVNVKGGQDEMRPLHMSCRYNNSVVTQMLLGHGADVNIRDIKGKTPLHYATRRGHDITAKVGQTGGICKDIFSGGCKCLHSQVLV